jgi:DNA mismatch repair ATPase MutS
MSSSAFLLPGILVQPLVMTRISRFDFPLCPCSNAMLSATADTLLAIDELGKGTEVKDAEALAGAILECLAERGSRVVFATYAFNISPRQD